jgi:transposase
LSIEARLKDLDLTCRSPYRPAASENAVHEGLTEERTRSRAHLIKTLLHTGRQPQKKTAVSVRRGGKRIWRGKCASDPKVLADLIRARAPDADRVVFETGQLSTWFYHALKADGVPAICIDARHAKAALDMAANKTDANDADGLAHIA